MGETVVGYWNGDWLEVDMPVDLAIAISVMALAISGQQNLAAMRRRVSHVTHYIYNGILMVDEVQPLVGDALPVIRSVYARHLNAELL